MRRRALLAIFVAGLIGRISTADAQQPGPFRRVGVLISASETDPEAQTRLAVVRKRLQELGWSEGQNIRFEYRFLAGDLKRARAAAAELISLAPDVILTHSTQILTEIQKETRTIPVVFAQGTDPVANGLAATMARPGGNMTGFTTYEPAMGAKWLELLKELAPQVIRATALKHPDNPSTLGYVKAIEPVAPKLGVEVTLGGARNGPEIVKAIEAASQQPNTGLIVVPDPVNAANWKLIVEAATRHRLPAVYPYRYFTDGGGLVSYGIDLLDLYARSGEYIDRILRGESPAEMPIQAPTKFELVVNLKAARALGLTVPPLLLAQADEVIE